MTIPTRQVGTNASKSKSLRSLVQQAEATTETASLEVFPITITPELAAIFLETCHFDKNRKVSKYTVAKYAKKMQQGQWGACSPITFSNQDHLIDGQHRLEAVVKAGVPVSFPVILGMPEETAANFDRGRRRTITDVSHVAGLDWVLDKHAATARWMCAVNINIPGKKRFEAPTLETEVLLPILSQYRDGIEFAVKTAGAARELSLSTILSVIAKAYYVYPEKHERLKEFGFCLKSGEARKGTQDNAALKLVTKVRRLKQDRIKSRGVNWSPGLHSECFLLANTALDLFLKEISPGKLMAAEYDLFPLPDIFTFCNEL